MDNKKQEAYTQVRDELIEKRQTIEKIYANVFNRNSELHTRATGILDGIDYALVIVDNLMLQDRKS